MDSQIAQNAENILAKSGDVNTDEVETLGKDLADEAKGLASAGAGVDSEELQAQGMELTKMAATEANAVGTAANEMADQVVNSNEVQIAKGTATETVISGVSTVKQGGTEVLEGTKALMASDEAQNVLKMAEQGGKEAQELLQKGMTEMSKIPVPTMKTFDPEAAKKTFMVGSDVVRSLLFDAMKLEIVRDFFQFLGLMVDSISFPAAFAGYIGVIARVINISFKNILPAVQVNWPVIIFFCAMIPWIMLYFCMKKDLNKDTKFAATRKARKALTWKYRNEKNRKYFDMSTFTQQQL